MILRVTALLILVLGLRASVYAQSAPESAGTIFSIQGSAVVERAGAKISVSEGMVLNAGDEMLVGEPGRVAIELPDGSYIRLASGSRMTLPGKEKKIGLLEGMLHFLSHSAQHPIIETQQVTAAIRGTEFTLVADREQTTVSMFSGSLDGESVSGRASLESGQGARFQKGKAPEVYAVVSSDRSVQWSMFVPFLGASNASPAGERALTLAKKGKTKEAIASLASHAKDPCDVDRILRGRLLISSGDIKGGLAALESCAKSTSRSAGRADALAALSSVRLTQRDVLGAEQASSEALRADPTSASARISRSFALQERGDLDGALTVIEEGDADNSEIQARRAELLFMFGRVPEARKILESIPDKSWYAETVYGFVLMADRSFSDAEGAFSKAASMEPGAGLPLVGLGIVRVNRGELADARKDFERAALLEPSRSVYRSYLGKDYFEDDLYEGAHPEYARAIELDPKDPTPHLYRSFMRLAENDLVGALEDLDAVRDLSGTRNVYRSQALLDQDSAVQSASIGRVYQQIGFKERGRIEAITALIGDYQNATAHRLLSQTQEDIFAADTIASEQRISNLFAPLSINVVDSIGTNVSLNEYSQLFERDGVRTAVNSFYDSKDDLFKSGVLSAYKNENIVLGLSADGVGRDGIADDPRTSAGTFGMSLQAQPSWADRFLLEGRGTISGQTDPELSEDGMHGTVNAAYLHKFSPDVTAIIQSAYDRDRAFTHRPFQQDSIFYTLRENGVDDSILEGVLLDQRPKRYETSVVNEAQLLATTGPVKSILTLHNSTSNVDSYDTSKILEDESGDLSGVGAHLRSSAPVNLSGNSASYLGTLAMSESLFVNFGGEFESIEWASQDEPPFSSNSTSRSLWSPKGGIVYRPDETIAARVGYGESLGKSTRTDLISIEPTLIGGITQRYNDLAGTRSQNLGFGLDLRPDDGTYVGAEWNRRWLDENTSAALYEYIIDFDQNRGYSGVDLGENYDVPIGQDFVSAYLYQVFSRRLVGGLDYRFVKQDINSVDPSLTQDQRGIAFTRYFFSNGIFLQGSATYRYQDRRNVAIFEGGEVNGTDGAWLMGAGMGYRLPHRHGVVVLDVQNIFGEDININQTTYFNEPVFNDPTVRLSVNFNF